jgi:hypothetical protein
VEAADLVAAAADLVAAVVDLVEAALPAGGNDEYKTHHPTPSVS